MGRTKLMGMNDLQALSTFSKMVKLATLTANFCSSSSFGFPEDVFRQVTRPISNSAPKKEAVATKRWKRGKRGKRRKWRSMICGRRGDQGPGRKWGF